MSKDTKLAVEESYEGQENLRLWKSVDKTPPNMTKHVKARGGYTTVDAQWQLRVATALWGPYGDRWNWRSRSIRIRVVSTRHDCSFD